jgi:hypothetical protein
LYESTLKKNQFKMGAPATVQITEYRYDATGTLTSVGNIRVNPKQMIRIDHEGPTNGSYQKVTLIGAKPIITDYSGASAFDWQRLPEYKKTKQEDGSYAYQYTTHGVRVNQNFNSGEDAYSVVTIQDLGIDGLDENGDNAGNLYAIRLADGSKVITDETGYCRVSEACS